MAIKPLTWRPGTCACVIDVVYDDAVDPQPDVPYTPVRTQRVCQAHAGLATTQAVFDALVQESQCHEWGRDTVLQAIPALARTTINLDGSTSVGFVPNVTVAWGPISGKGRRVIFTVPNLTPAQRTAAQAAIDARLGAGKVQVA